MAENKVQFNVKNVHIAKMTAANTWATPIPVPACVTLTLDKEASITPFYADGIVYYNSVSNNGYTGSIEVARIPDAVLTAIWGFTVDTDGVITEDATVEPSAFALLFETDGDVQSEKFVFYNCSATAPSISASTTTDTKEPQTQTIDLSAIPLSSGEVFARTTDTTAEATLAAWYTAVQVY